MRIFIQHTRKWPQNKMHTNDLPETVADIKSRICLYL